MFCERRVSEVVTSFIVDPLSLRIENSSERRCQRLFFRLLLKRISFFSMMTIGMRFKCKRQRIFGTDGQILCTRTHAHTHTRTLKSRKRERDGSEGEREEYKMSKFEISFFTRSKKLANFNNVSNKLKRAN